MAEWPADPPEIEAGFLIRFEARIGSSYRPLPMSAIVVPRKNVTPGEQAA